MQSVVVVVDCFNATYSFRGRSYQSKDGSMHSLSCFAKMLKPTSYFTDAGLNMMGAAAQIASRGRWALAHVNQNLRIIHEV